MNSKKKKIVGVIVALVIVAAGIVGLWYALPSLYETDEPAEVSVVEDELLYSKMMADGSSDMEQFKYTLDNVDSEYIWLDIEESSWTWDVYKVSKESLENNIEGLPNLDRGIRVSDMKTIKKDAEIIVKNFGVKNEKTGMRDYLTYSSPTAISCLNGAEFEGVPGETFTISPYINEEGLILSYDNVCTKKVMTGNSTFFTESNDFVAEVTADVTCEENSGSFKDVSWIPEKGSTTNVTFVVYFRAVNDNSNIICVHDVGVK